MGEWSGRVPTQKRDAMIRAAGRFVCAAIVVLLIAVAVIPAGALAGSNCFGLSASDCRLVGTAANNIGRETSFQFAFNLSVKSNTPNQNATITAKGNGALAVDSQGLQDSLVGSTSDIYKAIKATLSLDLSSQATTNAGFGSQTTTGGGHEDLIVLDGVTYVRTTGADHQLGDWKAS